VAYVQLKRKAKYSLCPNLHFSGA